MHLKKERLGVVSGSERSPKSVFAKHKNLLLAIPAAGTIAYFGAMAANEIPPVIEQGLKQNRLEASNPNTDSIVPISKKSMLSNSEEGNRTAALFSVAAFGLMITGMACGFKYIEITDEEERKNRDEALAALEVGMFIKKGLTDGTIRVIKKPKEE